jgi:hypothetical protein
MRKPTHWLGCSATQSTPIITAFAANPNVEGHSRQDPTRGETRTAAAAETLRAAASGPKSATVKGSYSGPPMVLGMRRLLVSV